MAVAPCPVCERQGQTIADDGQRDLVWIECRTCGKYGLTGTAKAMLRGFVPDRRRNLSAFLRDAALNGQPTMELSSYDLDSIPDLLRIPRTVGERLERIGRLLEQRQERIGLPVKLVPEDEYPVPFAKDGAEFYSMMKVLEERKFITLPSAEPVPNQAISVGLTAAGIDWLDRMRLARPTQGNLVFVAMAFDDPYKAEFEPGVKDACTTFGYNAEPLYKDESNAMWMDRILSRIRDSRFVVADLSEHRGGVYLEAGYALGRNIPVIFTCKDDRFDLKERVHATGAPCDKAPERAVAHSDAKNWMVIRWTSTGDLKKKLESRIGRAVGRFTGSP